MIKHLLTTFTVLAVAGSAHAVTVNLGDQTLNTGTSNDGWSSNMHVMTNTDGPGPGGEVYQYTNTGAVAETITPGNWGYAVQGGATPDFATFNVTPYLVRIDNGIEDPTYTVMSIGQTRIGGAGNDFNAVGVYSNPFAGASFNLAPGESIGIGVIDSNATGTGPAHSPAGGVIPFDGGAGGDNNHWYNGDPAANTYPNGTPGGVGIGGALTGTENANINRNYQFNISVDASPVPEPTAGLLGLLGMGLLLRRRR